MMLAVLLTYDHQDTTITGITHHTIDIHNPIKTEVECIKSYKRAKFITMVVNLSCCQHMVVCTKQNMMFWLLTCDMSDLT
jgi:hypothetical protein